MDEQLPPKTLRLFLGKQVIIKTYEGGKLRGELVNVDRSGHGAIGNLILRWDGGLSVVRGDAVRFIALDGE